MTDKQETFAERLARAMAAKGYKQADLIRIAGDRGMKLGKSQVSQYANGKTVPRRPVGEVLADMLGVPAAWLMEGAGEIEPEAASRSAADGTSGPASSSQGAGGAAPAAGAHADASATPIIDRTEPRSDTMREIKKSTKLDNVLYDVRGPVVEEAERMEEAGARILKLNIGNPAPFDFRAPEEMVFDMSRQLAECEGYSSAKGLFSARKAIMQYAQLKHIQGVDIDDVYTGNGVSELINLSMLALLDNGDEVLVPSPDYPLWTACVTLAGGTPVHYVCDEQAEWYPDMDDIRKKITSRTKALVIINPNNPTGSLYPREVLQELVDIAREHDLIIFSDEIYDRIVMDGLEHISIASMAPDVFCVTFSGLSKSHMVAGYRIGWMVLSGDKARARDYILGGQHAVQHAHVLERSRAVHRADGSRRPPERAELHRAGRTRVRAARVRVQRAQRHPRRDRGEAQGGLLHLPEARREEVQHHGRREVRARPAAREAPARGARRRLQLEEARPLPRGVPAAHRGAGRRHARPGRLPGPLSASVRAPGSGAAECSDMTGNARNSSSFGASC